MSCEIYRWILDRIPKGSYLKTYNLPIEEISEYNTEGIAALIIDMQPFFLDDIETRKKNDMISAQKYLVAICRYYKIPLVFLEYTECGKTITNLTSPAKYVPKTKSIKKNHDNGFEDTDLESYLIDYHTKTVILAGVDASLCVKDTARGALDAGFEIATSEELIADPAKFYESPSVWYQKNGVYEDTVLETLVRCM